MLSEAKQFWDAISGKIKSLIRQETANTFRCERYEVTTAPNGTVIGVTKAFGEKEILLPYSKEVASAVVGQPVLVVWWGSMSNAKVYYYANGYMGASGGGGGGEDGATFIPSVSEQGIISWTNDGGLPNPAPVNIKGPQGDSGVYYGTDTPPAGTKVWVDPSGSTDIKLNWELVGTVTSTTAGLTYPENAKEIFIKVNFSGFIASNVFPVVGIQDATVLLLGGYYYSSSDTGIVNLNHSAANRTIQVRNAKYGSVSFTSMSLYWR